MLTTKKTGWLEVQLNCPKEWVFSAQSGGLNDGYMRFDLNNTSKLEVKWERIKENEKVTPMIVISNFIDGYGKTTKSKKKNPLQILDRGSIIICEHKGEYIRWQDVTLATKLTAVTIAWVCNQEKKAFLAGYYLGEGEKWDEAISQLTHIIVCHTDDKLWNYNLMGTYFKLPKNYRLVRSSVFVANINIQFSNVKGDQLFLYWASFGQQLLAKHKDVINWFNIDGPKELREIMGKLSQNNLKFENGKYSMTLSNEKSFTALYKKSWKALQLWYDEKGNKIFVVCYSGHQDNLKDYDALSSNIEVQTE